jgi:hypothetical protein
MKLISTNICRLASLRVLGIFTRFLGHVSMLSFLLRLDHVLIVGCGRNLA